MRYWENGFYEKQNELNTRKEITDERWKELLKAQSNGFTIITGEDGYPVLKAIDYSPTPASRIQELKKMLLETDYQAIKYAEGLISNEDYIEMKSQRQKWRDEINLLEESEQEKGAKDGKTNKTIL